jgi:non-specific serine/threonine protein kinase
MPASLASRGEGEAVVVRSEQNQQTFQAGMRSFIAEARMLAQFKHPALVEVFRFWEQNGTAYMAMPYYKGRTLRQVLHDQNHAVDERWLKSLFAPLMDALELMHGQNIYHRDVAPDNILILANGAPVLLDLGAARRIIGDLTQVVTVVLKPGYAPVEQYADDGSATQGPWTDIYAIGAVLYFAIVGRAPVASVSRIMKDTLKPLDCATYPGYSEDFLAGIGRALAVKPEDRPQSIAELREVLGVSSYAATSMYPPVTATGSGVMHAKTAAPATAGTGTGNAMPMPTRSVSATHVEERSTAKPSTAPIEPAGQVAIDALFQGGESAAALPLDVPGAQEVSRPPASDRKPAESGKKGRMPMLMGALLVLVAAGLGAVYFMGSTAPTGDTASNQPAATPPSQTVAAPAPVAPTPPSPAPVETPPTPTADTAGPGTQTGVAGVHTDTGAVTNTTLPTTSPPTPPAQPAVTVTKPTSHAGAEVADKATDSSQAGTAEGKVRFSLQPWGEVWVDGVKRGPSPPLKTLKLAEGNHRIELRNPGFPTEVRKIQVKKGAVVTVDHHFSSDMGYGGI